MHKTAPKFLALTLLALLLCGLRLHAQTLIIPTGATWKYLDTGSDQGAAWQALAFDDNSWSNGLAQLGYGDSDETTVVSFGADANNKFITTYFRHTFFVANPAGITNLLLRTLRDDGVVIYLNGTEVFRDNMPAGPVAYTNLATVAATDDGTNYHPMAISAALLANNNIIAVEVHQSAANSSDLSFDLELTANYIPAPPIATLTNPTNTASLPSGNIVLQAAASDTDGAVTNVEFYAGGTKIGEDATAGYSLIWSGVTTGAYVLTAVATDATGLRGTSAPVNVTVVAAPPSLIAAGSVWRYHNLGQNLGTTWTNLTFDDSTWGSGPGTLGANNLPIATTIGIGPDGARFPTIYFRRTFNVANPSVYGNLQVNLQKDDGAVVFINGVEVLRAGMADPPAVITYTTLATFTADDAAEQLIYTFNIPATPLVAGTNIVAVEVHQVNATSSDLVFDLGLIGNITPTVAITSPSEGQTINLPSTVAIEAAASDSDGTISRVDFYRDGLLIGGDSSTPFSAVASNLMEGAYALTAVAQDNSGGNSTSAPINIIVVDPNPPGIVGVQAGTNTVIVNYTKAVAPPGATNGANYSINNGISVLAAAYGPSSNVVILTTTLIPASVTNTLTVNNVPGVTGGVIAPNTQVQFATTAFTFADIGAPLPAGSTAAVPGGNNLSAGGLGIDGSSDQFHFNYKQYIGDFDVMIRLQGLTLADTWSAAGLMARETLAANSRYYASVATPAASGCFFQYRTTAGAAPTKAGYAPVTYPNTWLRMKRAGNDFSGFFSVDGLSWQRLGLIANQPLSAQVYVGMFVASRTNNVSATAEFRDFSDILGNPPVASQVIPREPVGPSSRKTSFAITEIMYNPREIPGSPLNSLEFIEIYNSNPFPESLGNFRITGDINYTFPAGTVVKGGGFVVVARDPAFVQSHYGIGGVFGPWDGTNTAGMSTNGLSGAGGLVRLRNFAGAVLLNVDYGDSAPYPVAADGAGHSLVLARASYGEGDARAWAASDSIDGSPGRDDPYGMDGLRNVVINEYLAHTDDPLLDYIELYNHANTAVDLSGAYLADEADFISDPAVTNHFYRFPNDTSIPARGFLSVNQTTLGFALSASGESLYLVNSNKTRVIDALSFDAQENGVSTGRSPDGAAAWYRMAALTPGASNGPARLDPIVINEIMYSPITGQERDEYIELYNRGGTPVDVSRWRFVDGITFTIPTNTVIPSNGFLVIAKSATNLLAKYPGLNAGNTVGDYNGTLGNGGERIALAKPVLTVVTNGGVPVTNTIYVEVNEVAYSDGGRWGYWTDGGGSSLELRDPWSDNRQPANWLDSDESAKGIWTTIEITNAPISEILGSQNSDVLLIYQLGVGECLVDDVEVKNTAAGANQVSNPGFETGSIAPDGVGVNVGGWIAQGSHDHSFFENSGFTGSRSLRLRAASRGDNGANRIRSAPLSPPAGGSTVTLRARAKWVRGWPELLLRLRGGGLEVGGYLPQQPNLGSPGLPNSRLVSNLGPAIYEVAHNPPLPAAGENVVVTVRVTDPDGPLALRLKYRVDPATSYTTVAMADNGTGGDAIADDGLYSATLAGQSAGVVYAFYLEAVDGLNATNTFPTDVFPATAGTRIFPLDVTTRELVLRWGDTQMMGGFSTYHVWLTSATTARWRDRRPVLNNTPHDGTFVYNNHRVIYNMRPQFAGSPWHRGSQNQGPEGSNRADYDLEFPEDDRFLGATDAVWNNPGNPAGNTTSDTSAQSEQTTYIIFREMGIFYNYRRYMHLFVNGNQRSTSPGNLSGNFIFEDSQQCNGDIIDEWFPDDTGGQLFKIEDWFEFPDDGESFTANNDADFTRRNVTGTTNLNIAAYRFMFRNRARGAGESANDYTNFVNLMNIISPPGSGINDPLTNQLAQFNAIADSEQWLRIFAAQHVVGNWDAFGYRRGKNAYMYKPENGPYHQWVWDIDFTMGIGGDGTGQDIFDVGGGSPDGDERLRAMIGDASGISFPGTPALRRAYLRAFEDAVNGPLNNSYLDPILDAKAATMTANNVTFAAGNVTTIKTYTSGRRASIISQLGGTVAPFFTAAVAGQTNLTVSSNYVTITGTAPVGARYIYINGVAVPVTWTTVSNWTARVALSNGVNGLIVQGYTSRGTPTNTSRTIFITNNAVVADPVGNVVFNELHYAPSVPDSEFVELHNNSAATAYDIGGWRINGLDYEFPSGTTIGPRQYLVVAKNMPAFAFAYGFGVAPVGEFGGDLDQNGETLTLIKPATTNSPEVVIDKLRYEAQAPWPVASAGSSIQAVDARVDNARVSNWSLSQSSIGLWRTFTASMNIGNSFINSTNFYIFLDFVVGAGSVVIDDLSLIAQTGPTAGTDIIQNGGFESPLAGTWNATGNMSNSVLTTEFAYSGSSALRLAVTNGAGGAAVGNSFWQTCPVITNTIYTLRFRYIPTTNANKLTMRFNSFARPEFIVTPPPAPPTSSPGTTNQIVDPNLPPYDLVWLNELQAENVSSRMDNAGDFDPWIELYNAGPTNLDLSSYYLADNYSSNLTQWQFPAGYTLAPGEFRLVWADGEPDETSGTNAHTSFRLPVGNGTVALVRIVGGQPQITDYLTYDSLRSGLSYGDFPDGQPFTRTVFQTTTPGSTNNSRDVNVFVNEWMAANFTFLLDPTDNNYDDWFELYNAGSEPVDLGGYHLTDDLGDPDKYQIPNNGHYVIPPGGHLLVWADNDSADNSTNDATLHVSFSLNADPGESLALVAPDGNTFIDAVAFGRQTNNISEGRYADGAVNRYWMTTPTPGSANVVPGGNTPPVLDPIADRTVRLGQTISFNATATDADVPEQSLTFTLAGSPPAGAMINPGGHFTWTPSQAQTPSTNNITVVVTDNGLGMLSDSDTFTVIVRPPPVAMITSLGGTSVEINFDTIPGRSYRVLYKDQIDAPMWTPLNAPIPASGESLTINDNIGSNPQRFYRIEQVD